MAENYKQKYETMKKMVDKYQDEIVPELRKQQEALIADMRAFAHQWFFENNGFPCQFCRFCTSEGACLSQQKQESEDVCAGKFFEWRGVDGERKDNVK